MDDRDRRRGRAPRDGLGPTSRHHCVRPGMDRLDALITPVYRRRSQGRSGSERTLPGGCLRGARLDARPSRSRGRAGKAPHARRGQGLGVRGPRISCACRPSSGRPDHRSDRSRPAERGHDARERSRRGDGCVRGSNWDDHPARAGSGDRRVRNYMRVGSRFADVRGTRGGSHRSRRRRRSHVHSAATARGRQRLVQSHGGLKGTALLVVRNVGHRYANSDRCALDAIDIRIEPSQCIALVGPSGSGKSTLLSIIGGVLSPTTGDVSLSNQGRPRLASDCAWIFQANYMIPRRSALDNVALAVAARGHSWQASRTFAAETLAEFGLESRKYARIEELSGGEVQRVAIARAFAQKRKVILADEPSAQLDRRNTEIVSDALVRLARSDRIVLVATHDDLVARRCDSVLRLEDGRVVSQETRAACN